MQYVNGFYITDDVIDDAVLTNGDENSVHQIIQSYKYPQHNNQHKV